MLILSIDQGTTGTTTVLYDQQGFSVASAYREFRQIYPHPGWVEHDPLEIWQTVIDTIEEVCANHRDKVSAIGITNQRETTILWDRYTGKPVYNAIVWQCRRTAVLCEKFSAQEAMIREKTGLPLDAYFSGTKIRWILDHVPDLRLEDTLFGTVDSWLIWNLTNGKVHATDFTNASRTLLFNIHQRCWDQTLCELFNIPMTLLPAVQPSLHEYGQASCIPNLNNVSIMAVAGDQQAALFGQTCFDPGQVKNTYGTGCFVVMNTGQQPVISQRGLVTTLAVDESANPCYALEGSIFIGGAAIQWLRDELQILQNAAESEVAAMSVHDNAGVYLVPAFAGLGAPHWDMRARGIITGLTRGTNRQHIIRAALESMAYQTADVLQVMEAESGRSIKFLAVDGGACANDFLMQFQSDIINRPVLRPKIIESTTLGVAFMAGLSAGMWQSLDTLRELKQADTTFHPDMANEHRTQLLADWRQALRQCRTT